MSARLGLRPSLEERRPEMGSFWIRFRPRRWTQTKEPWVDLAGAGIGLPAAGGSPPSGSTDSPQDVLYLPPCDDEEVARQLATWGCTNLPAVVQRRVGQGPLAGPAVQIWDPLAQLLEGDRSWVEEVPAGGTVVWPLLPGLAPEREDFRGACARLHERGVALLRPLRLGPDATALRRLAARYPQLEERWEQLVHAPEVEERPFFVLAAAAGLSVRFQRPGSNPGATRDNRRIASVLTETGELWLRLGRSESAAQEFFRAAREAEQSSWELATLWREGNLQLLDWLAGTPRSVVVETLESGASPTLEELWSEYLI